MSKNWEESYLHSLTEKQKDCWDALKQQGYSAYDALLWSVLTKEDYGKEADRPAETEADEERLREEGSGLPKE